MQTATISNETSAIQSYQVKEPVNWHKPVYKGSLAATPFGVMSLDELKNIDLDGFY